MLENKNLEKLTQQEIAILKLVTKGFDNQEISKDVYCSIHTVKAHISSILRKLNARNRTNAVYIAMINNLLSDFKDFNNCDEFKN